MSYLMLLHNVQKLEWDTQFFGYPVYKATGFQNNPLLISSIIDKVKISGCTLLYWFSEKEMQFPNDIDAELVDVKIDYVKKIDYVPPYNEMIKSYPPERDYKDLLELSFVSGEYSRFRIDKHFVNNEYHRLYTEWLMKSVQRKNADEVFVFEDQDGIQGFVTSKYEKEGNNERIGLIAVREGTRGKNIGRHLVDTVVKVGKSNGAKFLKVYTQQSNIGANRFYEKCQFKEDERTFIYHIWFKSII